MRRPFVLPLLIALVSAACAAAPKPPSEPPPGPVPVETDSRVGPVGPATDPCAEFNAREAEAARRHREPGECPHCPCACVGGEIRCAPCARCEPRLLPTREVPGPTTSEP